MPLGHCELICTYFEKLGLHVVLLSRVKVVVHGHKAGAPATAKLGLEAKNCDSVLRCLELLADLRLDDRLLDASHLGVDQLNSLRVRIARSEARLDGEFVTVTGYLPSAFCPRVGSQ